MLQSAGRHVDAADAPGGAGQIVGLDHLHHVYGGVEPVEDVGVEQPAPLPAGGHPAVARVPGHRGRHDIHRELWDYNLPPSAGLMDIERDGEVIPGLPEGKQRVGSRNVGGPS